MGLKRAGFKVVGAVEIEKHAFATYKANHPEVHAFRQDVRTVKGQALSSLSPTGIVDVLAGCPPCQGFSSLTSKYVRDDPRNKLIAEMARLIMEIKPNAVMMENVPGLLTKGKSLFDEFVNILSAEGYICDYDVLQVADYGVPQSRRRLVLLAGRNLRIPLPKATHARFPKNELKPWLTMESVIKKMPPPIVLKDCLSRGGPGAFNWHVVRCLSTQNQRRLSYTEQGQGRNSIPRDIRPNCHKDIEEGFQNVYGRMSWSNVAPTITGGCTTLSKGRFGHPEDDRTISVREAALLQTFPIDYILDTQFMDYACDIVGNALPCDFAEILGRQVYLSLRGDE